MRNLQDRIRKASETAEEASRRREMRNQQDRIRKASETTEEASRRREMRNQQDRIRKASETTEEASRRREMRNQDRIRKANETTEEASRRREMRNQQDRIRKASETTKEASRRRETQNQDRIQRASETEDQQPCRREVAATIKQRLSEKLREVPAPHHLDTATGIGLDYAAPMRSIMPQPPIPVNPDVKLKHLPFYDVLGELMKPSSLIPKNSGRMQETLFVFHLTPQQAQDITMSRDFRPGAKLEYTVQVQLRFCLLETTCEQADTFPSQIQVRVNNKPATLPNVIPTNKPNVEPKRPGRPVDITNLCRLSPTVSNAITVSWAADFTRSFCMAVYLVKKLTSDILLSRLKQFGNHHSDHTKALIKEKLAQDPDSEIATTSLRVSLICPLGKMRIQIPCRASICTHLQCFDASTFLMMNERKPTWMCPVCDRPCPYDKLIIDGYFVEIFKQSPTCSDIIFHEDGSWSPMKPQKESPNQVILTPGSKVSPTISQPSLSSSLPSQLSYSTPAVMTTVTSLAPAPKPPETKGPVIDLTLDSSDEDDDSVIPSDPVSVSPPPVINLDTPSPAPIPTMPGSPTVILSSSQSSSPSPAVSSHVQPQFPSSSSYNGPSSHSSSHSRESPSLSTLDNLHQTTQSISQTSPSSSLQSQALNLEAMSDADFDEFLKGLSWGV
ncbi:E3 SUMO-protein ligase pias1 [Bulinus truncatus]|nr:E3 SUMO-protein ligase pias1 [Bulinus truncatus]